MVTGGLSRRTMLTDEGTLAGLSIARHIQRLRNVFATSSDFRSVLAALSTSFQIGAAAIDLSPVFLRVFVSSW